MRIPGWIYFLRGLTIYGYDVTNRNAAWVMKIIRKEVEPLDVGAKGLRIINYISCGSISGGKMERL